MSRIKINITRTPSGDLSPLFIMSILSRILEKKGIKDITQLDTEERETFEHYQAILSKKDISVEDLKHFLQAQIKVIEAKWKDYGTQSKADLIPYHVIYRSLLDIITSPQAEREQLEKYLTQLHTL